MSKDHEEHRKPDNAADEAYDEALLSANWNPVIELLAWSCDHTIDHVGRDAADNMSESEIDAFLERIYANAR